VKRVTLHEPNVAEPFVVLEPQQTRTVRFTVRGRVAVRPDSYTLDVQQQPLAVPEQLRAIVNGTTLFDGELSRPRRLRASLL